MEDKTEFNRELDERLTNTWSFIFKIWYNKKFQLFLDVCRILTVFLLIWIIYTLIKEIEVVKILGKDVCAVCMNKTGATCWLP